MAQFYTLLERAVRGLQPNTEGARQEIYARARSAVVEELRAIDPPLAPAERMRREQELEEAIRNVEREYGSGRGASGAVAIPATASTAALDGDRTGRAVRHEQAGDEPGLDSAIPPRSSSSRLLLLALLALVVAGASYAAYTYRVGLQDFFASLTGGNEPTESTVAAADAGVGGDVEALAPVAVAAVIPTQSFLYEDLGTGDALAIEGTVAWALVNDPDGTRIEVRIDIPARGLQVVLSMQEADGAIGVSHTLDVLVTTPANDGGRAVQSIALLSAKTTEDAIGTVIVAQSSTVSPGHFRLDLAAENERQNLLQIRRDWFDLGLVYANGERAILTFNKGTQGHEAMQQALAAWQA